MLESYERVFSRLFKRLLPTPVSVECQLLDPEELDAFFTQRDFFPRPDWQAIADKLRREHSERWLQAWDDTARIWLRKLVDHLGEPYQFTASTHFLVLSALPDRRTGLLHDILEHTRRRVTSILDNGDQWKDRGFHVLLLFDDSEALYRYMSAFGKKESIQMAGGFVPDYYMHMGMVAQELWRLEPIIVHEMTHNLLAPSELPLWLEEGVCQVMEGMLGFGRGPERDTGVNQRAFWSKHGLQSFWDGSGFSRTKTSEKAYELARVLVLVLSERKRFLAPFVKAARWDDAGFGAAAELGLDLEEVVKNFLGPGDWKPDFAGLAS